MGWVIIEDAARDIDNLSVAGALRHGRMKADRYLMQLVDTLDTLAAHPYMAQERRAKTATVRVMPCGAHNIIYAVENEDVVVLRVLHGLQDWFALL